MRKQYMNIGEMASSRSSPDVYRGQPYGQQPAPVFSKGRTLIDDMVAEPATPPNRAPVQRVVDIEAPRRYYRQRVRTDEPVEQTCKLCSHLMFQNILSIIAIVALLAVLLVLLIRRR